MKVLHVISSISRQSGGPSRSSQGLVAGLRAAGVDAWLMTLSHGEMPWIKGVDKFVNGGDFVTALEQVKPEIVHIHGIWSLALHRCAVICRRRKIPYVIAPRGMLEPWSLKTKWLKKRVARFLYQDRDLKLAAALHATAASEAEQFRRLGFRNPVIVSPNGVNVPERSSSLEFEFENGIGQVHSQSPDADTARPRRALFVSRMHKKKGVLELVESWARVVKGRDAVVRNDVTSCWYDIVDANEVLRLPIVRLSPDDSALTDRRAVKDVFKSFGLVVNESDGRRVTFPAKSAGKMLGQRGIDLYRVAGSFAKLFCASRRAWSETEAVIDTHKQHRNIAAYHQYIAKFSLDEEICYIRFTVREESGGKNPRNEVHSSTVSRIIVYKAKGVELSNLSHAQAEDSTPFVDDKIAFFLTRVNEVPIWQCELVYTLNGDEEKSYESKVKAKVKELGLENQFVFTGPLSDDKKWEAYARADLFVLPTYSENFGIVVAEALWAGVPVITTKGTPWSDLVSHKAGWWIDLPPTETLDNALRRAFAADNLRQLGVNGHQLVENKYTWPAVCKAMVKGYERILT